MIIKNLSKKTKRRERGMASLLYIMLIALILGMTGLSIDGAMGNYTSNSLKDASNTASVAASGETYYVGSKRAIDKKRAISKFTTLYNQYRKNYPNVTIKGPAKITYSVTKSRGSSVNNTFKVNVKEKSKTHFLGIVGVQEFNHNIGSTARLGALYENAVPNIVDRASTPSSTNVDNNIKGSWG